MIYQTTNCPSKVETLLSDMAPGTRIETACNVAQDYAIGTLSSEDHKSAERLIKFLINDADTKVRVAIANGLNTCPHLVRDIAFQLAMDCENVALPILRTSYALDESDLIEILTRAGNQKQIAIAVRKNLPTRATHYIAEYCNSDVVATCLKNHSASISQESFKHMLQRFTSDPEISKLMIKRPDLPEDVLVQLYRNFSEDQNTRLLEAKGAPHIIADQRHENKKEQKLADLLFDRESLQEKQKAAIQLERDGRLTFTLLLRLLIMGDDLFFSAGLSKKSGTSVKRVLSLFSEFNSIGLKSLLHKAVVPSHLKTAFNITLDEIRGMQLSGEKWNLPKNQTKVLDRISRSYNYETNLTVEKSMEKLLQNE